MFNKPLNLLRIIPAIFTLIGLGLLVGAYFSYRSTESFLHTAVTATGEVIGYERRNDSEGAISYYPVITFTPANGDEVQFTSSTGGSNRPYAIGAKVPLRYDPAVPFNASIDTPTDLWLAVGVLSFLGVMFVGVGGGLFWFFRPSGPLDQPQTMNDVLDSDFESLDEDSELDEDEERKEVPQPATSFEPKVVIR